VEGIRIYRNLPGSKLILSGGGGFDPVPNAKIMANVASILGINDSDMILEPDSKDTKDEAILIQKIVGDNKFILVTTASHMPRSMALFKKRGMQPIPAPIDHAMKRRQGINPGVFFPSSGKIRNAERVFTSNWVWRGRGSGGRYEIFLTISNMGHPDEISATEISLGRQICTDFHGSLEN
jgi:uncharacterized SAM-binding protein YcdF (DUF218 family)